MGGARRLWVSVIVWAVLGLAGCGSGGGAARDAGAGRDGPVGPHADGGHQDGAGRDVPNDRGVPTDAGGDAGGPHDGAGTDGGSTGTGLVLVAGALGGPGNLDGIGATARFDTPLGLAWDGAGNLFVADSGNGTIRKVAIATATVTTLAGASGQTGSADGTGTAARFSQPAGLAYDGAGNLYVADPGNNTIRRVAVATGAVTTVAGTAGTSGTKDGVGAAARFNGPYGLALDGAGDLFVADEENDTVRKIVLASGTVSTFAGTAGTSGYVNGIGTAAVLFEPVGITFDGAGTLFVIERGTGTLRTIVLATAEVSSVPDTGGAFEFPLGAVADGAGNVYVADTNNFVIKEVVVATDAIITVAGTLGSFGTVDGIGPAAGLGFVAALALGPGGELFFADGNMVRTFDPASGAVVTFAGRESVTGSTDGTGAAARFDVPVAVTTDGAGNAFIADLDKNTIRRVALETGAVTTLAGTPGQFGHDDGIGPAASFYYPRGVTSDGAGNLFVTDTSNNLLRKVVIASGAVSTVAGSPTAFGGVDGTGATATFFEPQGVASDGAGQVFVVDRSAHTVRQVVTATGVVTTLAGVAGQGGTTDGTGSVARFLVPEYLACDGAGHVFVSDSEAHNIREIQIATGATTTLAGMTQVPGSADGTGAAAEFNQPLGLAYRDGSLYVADYGNHTIRKVVVATGQVTTVVGRPDRAGVVLGPLPAVLNMPIGVAFAADGEMLITDENALLGVR